MPNVLDLIRNGWPDRKEKVPYEATSYFNVCNTLNHEGSVILKSKRIVIPNTFRSEMKRRLHTAHMSYDNMMVGAQETIFWPRMSREVKKLADGCEMCQHAKPKQQNEPLTSHNNGNGPWTIFPGSSKSTR